MAKFKVGDKVRLANKDYATENRSAGTVFEIVKDRPGYSFPYVLTPATVTMNSWSSKELELITEGGASMARKTYKLKKDTPTVHKGAIFQEACDDGTQEYIVLTPELIRDSRGKTAIFDRSLVEEQPTWFEEVFKVEPQYMNREELDQWEAFKGRKGAQPAAPVTKTVKGSRWSEAQREAQSAAMKAAWRRRKAAAKRAA